MGMLSVAGRAGFRYRCVSAYQNGVDVAGHCPYVHKPRNADLEYKMSALSHEPNIVYSADDMCTSTCQLFACEIYRFVNLRTENAEMINII